MYIGDMNDSYVAKVRNDPAKAEDQAPQEPKTRVVIFGSFYRGYHILNNLLNDPELMKKIEIVGVATDDVTAAKRISLDKRVWRHPHTPEEEVMVERLAQRHGIPVYKGPVKEKKNKEKEEGQEEEKKKPFYEMLENEWKPDIIYMGTFGQLLDARIIATPRLGIFNAHPADGVTWPSCVGPDPFEQMFNKGITSCAIALHHVNEEIDNGHLACFSEKIDIPYDQMKDMTEGEKVVHMHKLTSPYAACMINSHLRSQIGMSLVPNKWQAKDAVKAELPQEKRAGNAL